MKDTIKREIKFRAWHKNKKIMMTKAGSLEFFNDKFIGIGGFSEYGYHKAKDIILMQFTGLLDKKGKEIYEGDIINYAILNNMGEIIYNENGEPRVKLKASHIWFSQREANEQVEIIGNIFQSKHLLKKFMKDTIEVPVKWLETLLRLSNQCNKDQEKWFEGENPLMPTSVSRLIGYSSSAKTIITNATTNHR